ncbi:MAG: NAD-dependent epimerase/dehydratase family protein [Bacillota bacterium]
MHNNEDPRPVVVIAGATGFVGRALLSLLIPRYRVIGLTREPVEEGQDWGQPGHKDLIWRQCDLFSLIDAEKALAGADFAFYLVHSMMPSARLTQGHFEDMDLIAADNFARAAAMAGVKQIIYLGGLVPKAKDLSLHLRSRLEVEETLGSKGVPVTALRAGLIIGTSGSTFRIMVRLVQRLKFMVFPGWMMSQTHPIALPDILTILDHCLGNPETYGKSFDVGGPDVMTYREMILQIAEVLGYKRKIYTIPFFPARVASFLLSVLTNSPRALVNPLVDSLKVPMVAEKRILQEKLNLPGMPFAEAVKLALSIQPLQREENRPRAPRQKKKSAVLSVRSVQRLPLPEGWNADWVALHYSYWLPRLFRTIVKVKVDSKGCYFYFRFFPKSLLDLTFSFDRSSKDRPLYYITGGLMARLGRLPHQGRLEFREVLKNSHVLVAIHDYVPSIPWFLYSITQARLHLWVMHNYRKHLASLSGDNSPETARMIKVYKTLTEKNGIKQEF